MKRETKSKTGGKYVSANRRFLEMEGIKRMSR